MALQITWSPWWASAPSRSIPGHCGQNAVAMEGRDAKGASSGARWGQVADPAEAPHAPKCQPAELKPERRPAGSRKPRQSFGCVSTSASDQLERQHGKKRHCGLPEAPKRSSGTAPEAALASLAPRSSILPGSRMTIDAMRQSYVATWIERAQWSHSSVG